MPTRPLITEASKNVTEAMDSRITCRQFLDKSVSKEVLRNIMETARRSPSGGNLQPWRIHVMTGDKLAHFVADGLQRARNGEDEKPVGPSYPHPLWEPLKTWRWELGMEMYDLMGIARDDKPGRLRAALRNLEFFNAPVGLIVTADTRVEIPQYIDIGIYLQSVMLLAREAGLHTAPQGWWRNLPSLIEDHLQFPDSETVVAGMSLGYGDPDAPVNTLFAGRAPLDELVHFYSD